MNRKTILYIAASLDGYIAKPNDDLSFLSLVEQKGEDYGYADFTQSIDTVIIGRKTYDWIMKQVPEYVHADKKHLLLQEPQSPASTIRIFIQAHLKNLLLRLSKSKAKISLLMEARRLYMSF